MQVVQKAAKLLDLLQRKPARARFLVFVNEPSLAQPLPSLIWVQVQTGILCKFGSENLKVLKLCVGAVPIVGKTHVVKDALPLPLTNLLLQPVFRILLAIELEYRIGQ